MTEQLLEGFKWALGQIPGIIIGVVILFATGFKDEYFTKRKDKREEKKVLAEEVIKIVNEGISQKYRTRPRSEEHVTSISIRLEAIHPKMAQELIAYLNAWKECTPDFKISGATALEEEKYNIEQTNTILKKEDYLIKEAHKLKK